MPLSAICPATGEYCEHRSKLVRDLESWEKEVGLVERDLDREQRLNSNSMIGFLNRCSYSILRLFGTEASLDPLLNIGKTVLAEYEQAEAVICNSQDGMDESCLALSGLDRLEVSLSQFNEDAKAIYG